MAQTVPPPPGDGLPRPLPRGGSRAAARNTRPRFQPADALWMALLAGVSVAVGLMRWGVHAAALYNLALGACTVALTYLLGWRASGRAAGVIAGLLLAASPAAPPSFVTLPDQAFALMTVAALFAFVAGSSLVALALTVSATALRPDGLLLGLLLLSLSLAQRRQRAAWGAALFLLSAALAGYETLHSGYGSVFAHFGGFHPDLLRWLVAPGSAFLTWFLLPFCGELGETARRARWLPTLLWALLFLGWQTVAGSPFPGGLFPALTPFLPLWAVLLGAGLARLLPALTGDIPAPAARYVIATLAVLSLVVLRARSESRPVPFLTQTALPQPTAPPAVPPPAFVPVAPQAVPTLPRKFAPKRTAHAAPHKAAAKPHKPIVRLYAVKNGRLVRRSKWAIQWDLTHPPKSP